ncbi:Ig-like domain-containing protein, partial [Gottfriedia sp. NPDC057991]|uniref:Ig-like domain-containing protein n=1 Tax=Gottfriedia sp. NPDC057991 TaxID=3346298 RepID=UPI0036DE5199
REAYDGLTQAQKEKVTEAVLNKLVEAETEINSLKDEAKLIDSVINKINELPTTITLSDEAAVVSAREAYDGLTQAQKEKVTEAVLNKLVAAEAKINSLKDEAGQVDAVINKINSLPATITISDETAVVSAREAYDSLTQAQKEKIAETVLNKLVAAESEINRLKGELGKVDLVINKINALPTTITLSDETAVASARESYDGLTQAQKEQVTETVLNKLVEAESEINRLKNEAAIVDAVINKINALPTTITLSNEVAVVSARKAYDELTQVQKGKVSTAVLNKLIAAENKIKLLKDQVKADAVQTKINALPSQIKLVNESAVIAARKEYNGLTTAQKNLVISNVLNKLVSAEKTIVNLKNAAKAVKAKIAALPTTSQIKLTSESVIKSARTAYNSLDSSQKSLVGSIARLTSAEARLAVIKADKTLPTIKGISNNNYYRTKKTIQISDNVGLLNVKLTYNGKPYTYYSGKVFAASGKYNIIATDLKGNKRSIVFYIDNKPPIKPTVKSITSSTTKATGKAEANSTVYIYQGSKKIGYANVTSSGTYSVKIPKQKKRTKLTIYVVDRAGNKGAATLVTVK